MAEIFQSDSGWLAEQDDPTRYEVARWSAIDTFAVVASSVEEHPDKVEWLPVEAAQQVYIATVIVAGGRRFEDFTGSALVLREAAS